MMEDPVKLEIDGNDGNKHLCRLIEKRNNENGHMIYTFRNEHNCQDFIICKDGNSWGHLQGELPHPDCIKELGEHLDSLEADKL